MSEKRLKRSAISNTVYRLDMLINVLSEDVNLFEKIERSGYSCSEIDLEKQYKRHLLKQLNDIKKELIRRL